MAYRALYRTYRPQTFDEVIGQKAIVKTLKNALLENKIAHAYLFCGPRGTGKTSMARLFAKALNCSEGIGHQCNKCENCIDITNLKHPDVYEIDAASNSGVDNIRKLIEQVNFSPIMGRYKVYIIDEVHAMSAPAFNALLKTLEEPPSNVVFILATTEPNKVLPTILSRVQRFDFSKVSNDELVSLMERVLTKENVKYEKSALEVIARLSDGGVRDALSSLDQAISFSKDNITLNDVYDLFGLFRIDEEIDLIKNIHAGNLKPVLEFVKSRYNKGGDVLRLHQDLINAYKDLLVYCTTRDPSLLTYLRAEEAINILITPKELRMNLDTLIKAYRDYKTSLNSYDNFEMALINLVSQSINFTPIEEKPLETVKEKEKPVEKVEVKKVEVAPSVTPSKIEVEPVAPIGTEFMKKGINITKDFILNIMVQGQKTLRTDLQKKWLTELDKFPVSPEYGQLVSSLKRSEVCIAANKVVIVKSSFDTVINIIDSVKGQELSQKLMMELFNLDFRIIAIKNSDYQEYRNSFTLLYQSNKLPTPKPIVFDDVKEEKAQTNAQEFLNSLKNK